MIQLPPSLQEQKTLLRSQIIEQRKRRPMNVRNDLSDLICEHALMITEVQNAKTVALYVARETEPGTDQLLRILHSRSVNVILPVLGNGMQRDWAPFVSMSDLERKLPGRPLEPTTRNLGENAIESADVILAPALAIQKENGIRLGHGGGWYDRVIKKRRNGIKTFAIVFNEEVFGEEVKLPYEPHDELVNGYITPSGFSRILL